MPECLYVNGTKGLKCNDTFQTRQFELDLSISIVARSTMIADLSQLYDMFFKCPVLNCDLAEINQ